MEYRRRRRRVRSTRRNPPLAGSLFCAALLVASIVYLIGVSSAGTWVAQNVVAPVFQTLGVVRADAQETEAPSVATAAGQQTSATVTKTLKLPKMAYYALQMGVYSSLDNASKQAASLQTLGAGGYIYADGDKYRVFAACYQNRESIKEVRARLSEEGMESASYAMEQAASEWVVTATEPQIAALAALLDQLSEIGERLYAAVYAFDKEGKAVAEGKAEIGEITDKLGAARDSLAVFSVTETGASGSLLACAGTILTELRKLTEFAGEDRIAFSAALKYAHIAAVDAVCRLSAETAGRR